MMCHPSYFTCGMAVLLDLDHNRLSLNNIGHFVFSLSAGRDVGAYWYLLYCAQ